MKTTQRSFQATHTPDFAIKNSAKTQAKLIQTEPSQVEWIQALLHDLVNARLHLLFDTNLDKVSCPTRNSQRSLRPNGKQIPEARLVKLLTNLARDLARNLAMDLTRDLSRDLNKTETQLIEDTLIELSRSSSYHLYAGMASPIKLATIN